ncbi:hypothetical protein [Pseudonocardia endophytica]|uniref:Excreted virulence factor EspC (Type VII ESX diderm) n=1 Tax=Pseudonocardia endophytica TaxID=401976 RepID=A0A4V2PHE7_PSEEN|nr:hypothetical protein [Pseudonocardia endophytica]TCK20426.1 hypothetical protein EV378_4385 [Pseudonocardia endophytica]
MDDGFHVDVTALTRIADQILDAVRSVGTPVVDGGAEVVGHARLAAGITGFHDRWAAGVADLTGDAREIATRLADCAEAYRRGEQDVAGLVVRAHDPEPRT